MRRIAVLLTIMILVAGCTGSAPAPEPAPAPPPAPAPAPEPEPAPAPKPTPGKPNKPKPQQPAPAAEPGVRSEGEDLVLTGMEGTRAITWSPSGRRAVVQAKAGAYLLDTAGPTLTPLAGFNPQDPPAWWSETELLWQREGRLQVRDLTSGEDRLLHDFGAHVIHFIRPDDDHYVANRNQGRVMPGYRFGAIVAGTLGGQDEQVLIETGHLIGRLATGQVLAVEGLRGGPLWAITPTGEKRLLSESPAFFAQLSPDRQRALWLTGSPPASSWLDLFRPAVAHADGPYDPPLTDLWTWSGTGDPVRISLGGTFSARAEFSPDGSRIALALNEGFIGPDMERKPGRLAVVEQGALHPITTFDDRVGLGIWLGSDGFQFMPPNREKTGAQAPIMRIDLAGQQSKVSGGLWKMAITPEGDLFLLNWMGDLTTIHWRSAAEVARVDYNPNDRLGYPLYAPPSAPYLPFVSFSHAQVWLKRLER